MADASVLTKDILNRLVPGLFTARSIPNGTDAADVTEPGCYTTTSSITGMPTVNSFSVLVHLDSGYYRAQLCIGFSPVGLWFRTGGVDGSVWKDWVKVSS